MTPEYIDRFLTLGLTGLGLSLAGGIHLILPRTARWFGAVISAVVYCTILGMAYEWFVAPKVIHWAGLLLFAGLVPGQLLGSTTVARVATAIWPFLARTSVRWGFVTTTGIAVLTVAAIRFEQDENQNQALDDAFLASMSSPEVVEGEHPQVATDQGKSIALKHPVISLAGTVLDDREASTLTQNYFFSRAVRHGRADDKANCHGWTFAVNQYWVSGDDVALILTDNGYRTTASPHPGDLAVYRQDGLICHTAVVRYVTPGQPHLLESKWGRLGVFLHQWDESLYGTDITYYHSDRDGHTLAGLYLSDSTTVP